MASEPLVAGVSPVLPSEAAGRPSTRRWLDTMCGNAQLVPELGTADELEASDYKAVVDLVGMVMDLPTSALWNLGDFNGSRPG